MKTSLVITILLFIFGVINGSVVGAHELSGYMAVEGRFFFKDPLFSEQEENKYLSRKKSILTIKLVLVNRRLLFVLMGASICCAVAEVDTQFTILALSAMKKQ